MLEGLLTYLNSPDLPDDPFVRIESIAFEKEDAILSVSVRDYGGQEICRRWQVKAKVLLDYCITEPDGELSFYERDHILAR